jgi:membrane-associated protein
MHALTAATTAGQHLAAHHAVLANPISPDNLLSKSALVVLAIVIFAECGLLVGFFLPGDTLLISAGISIAIGTTVKDPLWMFLVVAPIAAILGNLVGYAIGFKAGPKVFDRPNSKLFNPEYVTKAHAFYERFGLWAVLLARFVPILRTVATVMAGVGKMPLKMYATYSIIGGILWTDSMLLIGHSLGRFKFVQENKQYLDYLILAIVGLSIAPTLLHYLRSRRVKTTTGQTEA